MSLCRLTVLDFTRQTGRFDERGRERYDRSDVAFGLAYAQDLLARGHRVEPIDGFDLQRFVRWCRRRLREFGVTSTVTRRHKKSATTLSGSGAAVRGRVGPTPGT